MCMVLDMAEVDYSASDIQVLEGLDPVRKRPGMYIGSTGARGLHHLVWEIVDNGVDEALAGHATTITVRVDPEDVITVRDDGRGIPVDIHPKLGVSAATVVFTQLHAGAKFDGGTYKVSGGLHGVGASVVNALSEWMEITIWRDRKIYTQRFERGVPQGKLVGSDGGTRLTGTMVRFKPDHEIFSSTVYNFETLNKRVKELAFLNGGLRIKLIDTRGEERKEVEHFYQGGIRAYVDYLNEDRQGLSPLVYFMDKVDDCEVEVCFQYHNDYSDSINSFVNCICTVEGGMHETGFKAAHTRLMNEYARKLGVWKKKDNLTGDDLREGMTAVISIRMGEVQFEGQTKTKLGNPEARAAVEAVVSKHLAIWLEENPNDAKSILDKAGRAHSARKAARKAREAVRAGQKTAGRTSMNGKLTRCSTRDPMERELFIVEGDSAGGSAKQARDRRTQAILPLRGKPLNTERATLAKVLANKEIMAVTQAIGAGVGSEFNLDDAQYGRVVILADADDDGAHIRCLLLTFFYRFMRDLVTSGRVYIAQPPLFKIRVGKKKTQDRYAWSDDELRKILALKSVKGKAEVQRFKGLGEMTANQLWETTMNPETRTLVRLEIDEPGMAEKSVTVLMGDSVAARKRWITENVAFGYDDEVPTA